LWINGRDSASDVGAQPSNSGQMKCWAGSRRLSLLDTHCFPSCY
jgi:hypothetical protein